MFNPFVFFEIFALGGSEELIPSSIYDSRRPICVRAEQKPFTGELRQPVGTICKPDVGWRLVLVWYASPMLDGGWFWHGMQARCWMAGWFLNGEPDFAVYGPFLQWGPCTNL